MWHHVRNRPIQCHRVIKLILKHIKVVQSIRICTAPVLKTQLNKTTLRTDKTCLVTFKASESACSGIPYTCSDPGKDTSSPTELGPINKANYTLTISILFTIWFWVMMSLECLFPHPCFVVIIINGWGIHFIFFIIKIFDISFLLVRIILLIAIIFVFLSFLISLFLLRFLFFFYSE